MQIWDANTRRCLLTMSSHSMAVSAVRWGGEDLIYSASRDTVINVWDAQVRFSLHSSIGKAAVTHVLLACNHNHDLHLTCAHHDAAPLQK